jgi:hypothetical protein
MKRFRPRPTCTLRKWIIELQRREAERVSKPRNASTGRPIPKGCPPRISAEERTDREMPRLTGADAETKDGSNSKRRIKIKIAQADTVIAAIVLTLEQVANGSGETTSQDQHAASKSEPREPLRQRYDQPSNPPASIREVAGCGR